jgi:hypothetical protein
MSIDPVATYGAQILAKDGIRVFGDVRSGIKATVKYLLTWANAYSFVNATIVQPTTTRVGLITYRAPYRLPAAVCTTPVYAQSFDIQPVGLDASLNILTELPYQGMAAGEFYSHAIVTLGFEQLPFMWDGLDDPDNLNQLDPSNPILLCEQSVKFADRMETYPNLMFRYVSTGKPVKSEGGIALPKTEADLVLRFPHVPYLPWQLLQPYLNTVNSAPIFLCNTGTLLFKPPETTAKQSIGGAAAMIEQSVTITLRYNPDGWNYLPGPDGTLDQVQRANGDGIFAETDFRTLFEQLSFSEES